MVLKGIPANISPQLLHAIASMGHGDTIVLADANFPSHSIAENTNLPLIREDCCSDIGELLTSLMQLFPLDTYDTPAMCMDVVPSDKAKGIKPEAPETYSRILNEAEKERIGAEVVVSMVERMAFYELAKEAFCVVASGDKKIYANVILRKGVIGE